MDVDFSLHENYTAKNANMFYMKAVRGPSQAYLNQPNIPLCIFIVFLTFFKI